MTASEHSTETTTTSPPPLMAFKGFDQDLKCRGFQYADGETYEHDGPVRLCAQGFHAATSPLDVLAYYPPATSEYRVVQLEGVSPARETDSKVVGRKLTMGAKINLAGLAQAHIEFVRENLDHSKEQTVLGDSASNSGNRSSASNSGNGSSASNSGDASSASNSGYASSASNSGNRSSASNSGNRSSASNSGNASSASNSGDASSASNSGYASSASNSGDASSASNSGYASSASNSGNASSASNSGYASSASNSGNASSASNSGNRSSASNSGYASSASNSGDASSASVKGDESVAIATGYGSKAAGALGCWIVLTERDTSYHILEVRAVLVDGQQVKAGVFYRLVRGELVEAQDQNAVQG
jgi:hypothetical protein